MESRYILLDAKNGEARYTIIDTKVISFDSITKIFWLDVGSFNENPLDDDGVADFLKVDYKTYKKWKANNFATIGSFIDYKELPIQARKFVGFFVWRRNGKNLDSDRVNAG